jgi:hypothetical protein
VVVRKVRQITIQGAIKVAFQPGANPWVVHDGRDKSWHSIFVTDMELDYLARFLSDRGLVMSVLQVDRDVKPSPSTLLCAECETCIWSSEFGTCGVPEDGVEGYPAELVLAAEQCPVKGRTHVG